MARLVCVCIVFGFQRGLCECLHVLKCCRAGRVDQLSAHAGLKGSTPSIHTFQVHAPTTHQPDKQYMFTTVVCIIDVWFAWLTCTFRSVTVRCVFACVACAMLGPSIYPSVLTAHLQCSSRRAVTPQIRQGERECDSNPRISIHTPV